MSSTTSPFPDRAPETPRNLDDDDLNPAAFLRSVRELSEKREREDNERFRKLEQEVEKGRQERLARRAEYARSLSPERRVPVTSTFSRDGDRPTSSAKPTPSRATPSRNSHQSTPVAEGSLIAMEEKRSPQVEPVPEFKGFGSRKSSSEQTPPPAQVSPRASTVSPSAAMPGRSGSMRWQQRPAGRPTGARPLPALAANNAQKDATSARSAPVPPNHDMEASTSSTNTQKISTTQALDTDRDQIAAALGSKDPAWFRQTPDRGIGNAAYRKSKDEIIPTTISGPIETRQSLPGMVSSRPSSASVMSTDLSSRSSTTDMPNSRTVSTTSNATPRSSNSTLSLIQARLDRSRTPSPTKELGGGGFVQSAMMKRSDSINKRSSTHIATRIGGLQGSHSMPKLEPTIQPASDSLVRPTSSTDLARDGAHARTRSITSAYTVNEVDNVTSAPSSPSKRWSPNKSSWIESALTAKEERPPSPAKNSQPTWMANLAKAKAESARQPQASDELKKDVLSNPPSMRNGPAVDKEPVNVLAETMKNTSLQAEPLRVDRKVDQPNALGIDLGRKQSDTIVPLRRVATVPQTAEKSEERLTTVKTATERPPVSPKPQIDFRSNLKPRAPPAAKEAEQPEFLSRFGTLRRTATEKYVAPDLLKGNILRGKAALAATDGPQKSVIRDEFQESILAKKEEWKKEKEEGVTHEHKVAPPVTPAKPEALAQREMLGRSGTIKAPSSPEKVKPTTPEALRKHQSIKNDLAIKGADKLVSRLAPQLANILARGPPPTTRNVDIEQSGSVEDNLQPVTHAPSELSAKAGSLQDMRKGRARGPKRRKAGVASDVVEASQESETAPKAAASPSTAAIMMASLGAATPPPTPPVKSTLRGWPLPNTEPVQVAAFPVADPVRESVGDGESAAKASPRAASPTKDIPAFAGFGRSLKTDVENKENRNDLSILPSFRKQAKPPQIQLPSKKDEEAAMRSAGLLASASASRSSINAPPKPIKSSRNVSGQLQEASPNKEIHIRPPDSDAYRALVNVFGSMPPYISQHNVDVPSLLVNNGEDTRRRTLRRDVRELKDGSLCKLTGTDEYVFFDHSVITIEHVYVTRTGLQTNELFLWEGCLATEMDRQQGCTCAQALARSSRVPNVTTIRQGHETANLLQAIGGILVTRCGWRAEAQQHFMLRGRSHLGHVVFDEVALSAENLCSAFVYLIQCQPAFLWQGENASTEELCAARLTASDLMPNHKISEVQDGAESDDFRRALTGRVSEVTFRELARAEIRLFRLQAQETKPGLFTSLFTRRPSWGSRSPAPANTRPNLAVKEIRPFLQADLEADGLYMLDAGEQIYILLGPLFAEPAADSSKRALFSQAVLVVDEYAEQCVMLLGREMPEVTVVFGDAPKDFRFLFRYWDDRHGLWSTAGQMAGSRAEKMQCESTSLDEVLDMIRWTG